MAPKQGMASLLYIHDVHVDSLLSVSLLRMSVSYIWIYTRRNGEKQKLVVERVEFNFTVICER